MLKIDFHMHTWHSKDSGLSPEKLIAKARAVGLDGIAITNHNSMDGIKDVERMAGKMIVFYGEEIKTEEGEIIALEIKEPIEKDLPLMETINLVKKQKGFIIVPHPFDVLRKGLGKESLDKIIDKVDAIEGINARSYLGRFNKKALEYAKEHGKPIVGGSDTHFEMEIGYVYTLVDSKPDKLAILKAIKANKSEPYGKRSGLRPHAKTLFKRFK